MDIFMQDNRPKENLIKESIFPHMIKMHPGKSLSVLATLGGSYHVYNKMQEGAKKEFDPAETTLDMLDRGLDRIADPNDHTVGDALKTMLTIGVIGGGAYGTKKLLDRFAEERKN